MGYINCLRKYAKFNGRASRSEYWGFVIANTVILLILLSAHAYFQLGMLHTLLAILIISYSLFIIIPTFAAMSRRWHDIGRTGLWIILNIVPIIGQVVTFFFLLGKGTDGDNEFGRKPGRKRKKRR